MSRKLFSTSLASAVTIPSVVASIPVNAEEVNNSECREDV